MCVCLMLCVHKCDSVVLLLCVHVWSRMVKVGHRPGNRKVPGLIPGVATLALLLFP